MTALAAGRQVFGITADVPCDSFAPPYRIRLCRIRFDGAAPAPGREAWPSGVRISAGNFDVIQRRESSLPTRRRRSRPGKARRTLHAAIIPETRHSQAFRRAFASLPAYGDREALGDGSGRSALPMTSLNRYN